MIKKVLAFSLLVFFSQLLMAQTARSNWVDSVYQALNTNAQIGQLFMIPVGSNPDDQAIREIENRIKSHEVGGLIFKNTNPHLQLHLINHFQQIADTPLLIALDYDGTGESDSMLVMPAPAILGALRNDTLVYQYGTDLARQLKTIGVNLLIGLNPVITRPGTPDTARMKYFGQDPINVASKSVALMRGLQDNGVLASTRNFPLKKVTVLDVRDDLPLVEGQADSVQRIPYTPLIAQNLAGIVGSVSGLDFTTIVDETAEKTGYSPESVAAASVADWVRKNMHFNGLTLIDARLINSTSSKAKPGDAENFAFQTGHDLIMYPEDVIGASRKIRKLAKKSSVYEAQLESSVKRILGAKFDAGLWMKTALSPDNIIRKLNDPEVLVTRQKIYESAVTILRDRKNILPLRILETRRFAILGTRPEENQNVFSEYIRKYVNVSGYTTKNVTEAELVRKLRAHTTVFVPVFPETTPGGLDSLRRIVAALPDNMEVIFCDFGQPLFLKTAGIYSTVITAYVSSPQTQRAVPQILFGALPANGALPFDVSSVLSTGTGVSSKSLNRLAYSSPEDARMESRILSQIDSIAAEAIKIRATPGCQVWVARKGKVIYEKSFGHLTYDNSKPVTPETIYDLASVTKVMATLQTAMFMQEKGIIDLNKKVSYYLPELRTSNKKDITILDMLTHQSGLVPFIPMYPQTVKDTTFLPMYYSRKRDQQYPLQVSSNLYASTVLRDSVWSWIIKSKLTEKPVRTPYSYKYSDLGFLILQRLAEKMLNQPLDEFMQQNYYEPLGAYTTGFTPLARFTNENIAPTEDDKIYRKSFVSGTVHDERAAMLGGIAGHAGLFSNANDLGKMGQMLLQGGSYGGIQYYKPETISLFTTKRFKPSRRGIGWDKPVQSSDQSSPTSLLASPRTFGHTGFTGTCIWVDPEFDLVYIFLSNRVYPDRNNKLSNANIRTRIQDVIYRSIFGYVDQQKQPYIVNDYAINMGANRPIE